MDPVELKIRAARTSLLLKKPFWGVIATRLKIIETNDAWNPTMATDGKHLYFNRKFTEALSDGNIQFVICHEILHCAFEHFLRLNGRKPAMWNMATDYAINWMLKRDGVGEPPGPIPEIKLGAPGSENGILLDEKYKDMTAEQIYDKLIQDKAKERNSLDTHIYVSDGDGSGQGRGEGGGDTVTVPTLSPAEAKEVRDSMREALIEAVKSHSDRNAGNVPGEISRMVRELLEPKINWRDLIANTIQSTAKSDLSFIRPSRKSWSNDCGAILPGRIPEETIRVACAIDVSGSISDKQVQDFLSEIRGIMSQYASFEVTLWSFDTRCGALAKFNENNQDELDEWVPEGGGGTQISANWDFMKKNEIEADALIVFTDLEDSSQNTVDPDYIDTVWIIQNPWNKEVKPPFGSFAYYE